MVPILKFYTRQFIYYMTIIDNKTKNPRTISYDKAVDNNTFEQDMEDMKSQSTQPPSVTGNNSVSGSTPDLESDDDVLQNAHQMGIAQDADLEHPKELNIAKDVDDAEEFQRTH